MTENKINRPETEKSRKNRTKAAKVQETKDAETITSMTRKSTLRKNIQSTGLTANGMIMRMKFQLREKNSDRTNV